MNGFFTQLFEGRASAGGNFHVSQTPPGWVDAYSGWDTATGVTITQENALQISAVSACVRVLSETVGSLPLILYRRREDGGKDRALNHPLYPLLHDLPNSEMTSLELRETLMGHVTTWGNAYGEIEYGGAGQILGLWPLRPDRMRVTRKNGTVRYFYTLKNQELPIAAENIMHIRGLGYDGLIGYSPIQMARQALGLAKATEEYGGRFFSNDARPGGYLQHPGVLSEDAQKRLTKTHEERHQGLSKSHRLSVLEEGMTFKEVGIPPEDAQFLETRKFQTTEIARIYRMQPHMIQDLTNATFSNIEHQSIDFVVHTIRPWLVRWEQAIFRDLLTNTERKKLYAEHLVDGLLRGDIKSRYDAYAVGRQNGWLSANDIRGKENMNPIENGDVYLVPLNMIPADQVGNLGGNGMESEVGFGQSEEDNSDEDRTNIERETRAAQYEKRAMQSAQHRHRLQQSYFRMYRDITARILRREVNDVSRAAKKFLGQRDEGSFLLWLEEFYRENHREFIEKQIMPLARSYGELVIADALSEIGLPEEISPELEDYIVQYVMTFAARHCRISQSRIAKTLQKPLGTAEEPLTPFEVLELELSGWEDTRSEETARWESVRFNNALAVAVYMFSGKRYIRSVAIGKSCPYCNELDGKVIGIQEFFLMPGDFQPEGAKRPLQVKTRMKHAPYHGGCDCMTVSG